MGMITEKDPITWLRRTMDFLSKHYVALIAIFVGFIILSTVVGYIYYPNRLFMQIVLGLDSVLTILFLICTFLLLVVPIYMLFAKKEHGCLPLLASSILIALGWIVMSLASVGMPDPYAALHPIPQGLKYDIPFDENSNLHSMEDLVVKSNSSTWLQVTTEYIGVFAYTFYYTELEEGEIYLRCFEAGTGEPLSQERLRAASASPSVPGEEFHCHVRNQGFVIYEGDPQHFYVARIEVWFRAASDNQERKLMEKFYRVDGYEH